MKLWFKKKLPNREDLHNSRWLRWLGPTLQHPRLWHMSRRGIAMGLAIGVFFGLLIPVAQIPFSAAVAVVVRANLPVAVASTLVTNPVTFGPLYFGAYRLGKFVLGKNALPEEEVTAVIAQARGDGVAADQIPSGVVDRITGWWQQLGKLGKPLVVGLAILATIMGLVTYFLVSGIWALSILWSRRRRLRERIRFQTVKTPVAAAPVVKDSGRDGQP
jgi:uncharacterized protein